MAASRSHPHLARVNGAKPLRGVVFDLDGVIVDTEHLWEQSWASYVARAGGRWTAQDTRAVQGMSSVEWARHIAQLLAEPALAPEINTACVEYVVAAIRRGEGPIIDGAGPLLAAAARGGPVALASSAPRRVIEAALEQHDLAGAFTTTVSSDEVAHGKPRPDVFLEAARRIGVTGADGLGVEDTSNGIRAAAAAGLVVLAIPNRRYPPAPDALELADFVTNDYEAARRYVERRMALGGAGRVRPS